MRAMAEWLNAATKVVFSRTLGAATWQNTQVAGAFDPAYVERMKRGPGKDIMIFGSGSIVSELRRHGLIDEYHFIVSPLLLGAGRPLFAGVPDVTRLELRECKAYASGNVSLQYARIG
jgi:dihydrofolate reductase